MSMKRIISREKERKKKSIKDEDFFFSDDKDFFGEDFLDDKDLNEEDLESSPIDISNYGNLSHQAKIKKIKEIIYFILPYSKESFRDDEVEKVNILATLLYFEIDDFTSHVTLEKLFDSSYASFFFIDRYENDSVSELRKDLNSYRKLREQKRVKKFAKITYLNRKNEGRKMVSFWLDDDIKTSFHEKLKEEGITMQDFLNSSVISYLEKVD